MPVRSNGSKGRRHVQRATQVLGLAMLLILAAGIGLTASSAWAGRLADTTAGPAHAPALTDTPTNTSTPCATLWVVVSSPNAGTSSNALFGVAAVSANDMWAVGIYYDNRAIPQTLIEHWNGTLWSVVESPNVVSSDNYLWGVAAASATDVWAVGDYYNGSAYLTLIEHWDGTSWSVVPSSNARTYNHLRGVAAVSSNDVWAVGLYDNGSVNQTLIEHWNGTSWSVVQSPNLGTSHNGLKGIAAASSNDVWAVGGYENGSAAQTLVEHWNGTSWSVVPSPNVGTLGSGIGAVAVVSASDVWAVGYYNNGSVRQTLIEHWDGTSWSVVPSPNVGIGSNYLAGVSAVSVNDVWAVGCSNSNNCSSGVSQTLTMHWDGTSWSVVPSPNVGTSFSELLGVAVVSTNDVWAVGDYANASAIQPQVEPIQTLVEHRTGTSLCITPTNTPVPTSIPTATICPINFSDVPPTEYFYTAVRYLYCAGVVSGYGENTFLPGNNTTRGQLCKIIVLAKGWTVDCPPNPHFSDVLPGSVFYCFVETAFSQGIVSGYTDHTFLPGNSVTRAQLCKIVVRAQQWPLNTHNGPHFTDVPETDPFYGVIETAYNQGVISGYDDRRFYPGNNATRGQICKIVYQAVVGSRQ